jgi:hypothetical protein
MKEYNLEDDLMTTEWIVEKCNNSENYCKELYAALCNNVFQSVDIWPTLKEDKWSCSWRYAGGIIAKIIDEGDYLDWYCGGSEGFVSEQIQEDLFKIGWVPVTDTDDDGLI